MRALFLASVVVIVLFCGTVSFSMKKEQEGEHVRSTFEIIKSITEIQAAFQEKKEEKTDVLAFLLCFSEEDEKERSVKKSKKIYHWPYRHCGY